MKFPPCVIPAYIIFLEKFFSFNCKILKFEGYYKNGQKYGKEYNYNGNLIFEGEYFNENIWNGKAKEYKNNLLIFEGEYKDGKRWKGKEYKNNLLIYECEYKEGIRNKGKGKEYFNNILISEIEYLNEYLSFVKEYYLNSKLLFEGEHLYGKKWNGIFYDIDGNITFEIRNGNGKGKIYVFSGNLVFEEEFENGVIKNGNIYCKNKLMYSGEYLNGKLWNGKGVEYDKNIIIFEGEYLNGKRHGKGKEYDNNR